MNILWTYSTCLFWKESKFQTNSCSMIITSCIYLSKYYQMWVHNSDCYTPLSEPFGTYMSMVVSNSNYNIYSSACESTNLDKNVYADAMIASLYILSISLFAVIKLFSDIQSVLLTPLLNKLYTNKYIKRRTQRNQCKSLKWMTKIHIVCQVSTGAAHSHVQGELWDLWKCHTLQRWSHSACCFLWGESHTQPYKKICFGTSWEMLTDS